MASKSVRRLPYFIEVNIWSRDFCETRITTDDSRNLAASTGMFVGGLPVDYIEFYGEHGRCAHCDTPISRDFKRCECGKPSGKYRHLDIKYPTPLYRSHFSKLFDRERGRVRAAKRAKMVKDNGGTFDKKHLDGMHQAQQGLCYFCGVGIELGSKSMHVDHYQPLAEGGRNDLANMVLTCAKCNLLKNSMHGDRFDLRMKKTRSSELKAVFREIRKNLKKYKTQQ